MNTARRTSFTTNQTAPLPGKLLQPAHALMQATWMPDLLAFGLPFALYLLTLAPSVYNLDSAELTTAAATGGLMRSTGYPLYLSLGYLWSKLPLGDVGFRMNLFSALWGAVTILLAYRILRRLQVGNLAAFAALGLLASSPFFWGLSLIAEVYTLHTALMAAWILALLRWGERPCAPRLFWVALAGGLSFSHHAASLMLVPGVLAYLLLAAPGRLFTRQSVLYGAGGLALGLSFYLYLPLRYLAEPAFNYAGSFDSSLNFHPVDLTSLQGLWWLVSGKTFQGAMLAYDAPGLLRESWQFVRHLWQANFAAGIGPGLLGLFVLLKRERKAALLLLLMFAFSTLFFITYRVMDKETMYLPSYLVWALWAGAGLQALFDWLEQQEIDRRALPALSAILAAIVLTALLWNLRLVDLSNDTSASSAALSRLQTVEQDAVVFGYWDTAPAMQYFQLVEGIRPELKVVNRFLIRHEDLLTYIQKEVNNRAIYIDSGLPNIPKEWTFRSVGSLYRITAGTAQDLLPASER